MKMHNPSIPAGLMDDACEIFNAKSGLMAIHKGSVIHFFMLPENILSIIEDDIFSNGAFQHTIDMCGSKDRMEILSSYSRCCFGGFNSIADITEDGVCNHEYWNCGKRGSCKFEGKVCQHVKVANGSLTKREVLALQLIASGKPDKQISDEMGISENTFPSYKNTIQQKTGLHTKTEMALLAKELNLI